MGFDSWLIGFRDPTQWLIVLWHSIQLLIVFGDPTQWLIVLCDWIWLPYVVLGVESSWGWVELWQLRSLSEADGLREASSSKIHFLKCEGGHKE